MGAAILAVLALAAPTRAATISPLAWSWWELPENLSKHGGDIDALYHGIFWLTTVVFIATELVLVIFLVRYRANPNRKKARFTHGNKRLEMIWTLIPAVIMLSLGLISKGVWDEYRYSPDLDNPNAAHVLIVARQFNWTSIYSGPDEKLGQYLVFPKPGDPAWPSDAKGNPVILMDEKNHPIPGPAYLPHDQALAAIRNYTQTANNVVSPTGPNEFGKVFHDPDGADDIIGPINLLELPVNRPTVLEITSMDVIHDFYLPNFRVNVYAVPGTRVKVALTPTMTSKDKEKPTRHTYNLSEIPDLLSKRATKELTIDIDENSPGDAKVKDKDARGWRYFTTAANGRKATVIRDGSPFPSDPSDPTVTQAVVDKLKGLGLTEVATHIPGYWEIVCAQLCGNNHTTMEGKIYVLDQAEWSAKYEAKATAGGASAAPAVAAAETR